MDSRLRGNDGILNGCRHILALSRLTAPHPIGSTQPMHLHRQYGTTTTTTSTTSVVRSAVRV